MASFNKVILLGNVTRDPELRYISSGTPVTEIGLAVNSRRKGPNGDWIEETTFVDITFWSRDAEIAGQYVTKGTPLLVEGRLKLDTWEKDGKKNSKLRVVGERFVLMGSREGGGREGGGSPRGSAEGEAPRSSRPATESHANRRPEDHFAEHSRGSSGPAGGGDGGYSGGSDDDIPF